MPGGTPNSAGTGSWRASPMQNASIVSMRRRWAISAGFSTRSSTRLRISAAGFLVKVMARMSSALSVFFKRLKTLFTGGSVFPEPAGAWTMKEAWWSSARSRAARSAIMGPEESTMRVIPGDTMPAIDARLAGGGRWALAQEKPEKLSLLAFYRGIFCPICANWVADLDRLVPEFQKRGTSVIALSCDPKEGAEKAVKDWRLKNLRIGYKLDVEDARRAGLYISEGRGLNQGSGVKEPMLFAEAALLLVLPEGELYAAC